MRAWFLLAALACVLCLPSCFTMLVWGDLGGQRVEQRPVQATYVVDLALSLGTDQSHGVLILEANRTSGVIGSKFQARAGERVCFSLKDLQRGSAAMALRSSGPPLQVDETLVTVIAEDPHGHGTAHMRIRGHWAGPALATMPCDPDRATSKTAVDVSDRAQLPLAVQVTLPRLLIVPWHLFIDEQGERGGVRVIGVSGERMSAGREFEAGDPVDAKWDIRRISVERMAGQLQGYAFELAVTTRGQVRLLRIDAPLAAAIAQVRWVKKDAGLTWTHESTWQAGFGRDISSALESLHLDSSANLGLSAAASPESHWHRLQIELQTLEFIPHATESFGSVCLRILMTPFAVAGDLAGGVFIALVEAALSDDDCDDSWPPNKR